MIAEKKKIKTFTPHAEHGAALVIAVLILLVLTVIGIYAITTTTFETKIAGFEREFKTAFYTADSGEPIGINVIKAVIHYVPSTRNDLPLPWRTTGYIDIDLFANGVEEIFTDGRNSDEVRDDGGTPGAPDMVFTGLQIGFPTGTPTKLRADIDRLASYPLSGGGTEYGSGYEGIGQGGGGDVAILYEIDSVGNYTYTNAESEIEAGYRHVVGMPAGE